MISAFFSKNKKTKKIEQLRKDLEPREFFANLLGWLQNADDRTDKLQQITHYYKDLPFATYRNDIDELKRYIEEENDKKTTAASDTQIQAHQDNIKILTNIQIAMVRESLVISKKSKHRIIL